MLHKTDNAGYTFCTDVQYISFLSYSKLFIHTIKKTKTKKQKLNSKMSGHTSVS